MTRWTIITTIANQYFISVFRNRLNLILWAVVAGLILIATIIGWNNFQQQNNLRNHFQERAYSDWIENPDKHPHRMAHYGYFAFRPKHSLSFFDFGMDSFTGVSIFLEAHKQNTVNFSESTLSTGLLRFGELSVANILQIFLPLLIFFIGFNSISSLRENGTLKIIFSQNVSWRELITGKTLGLIKVSCTLYLLIISISIFIWLFLSNFNISTDESVRMLSLVLIYFIYICIICFTTVFISALNSNSRVSLIYLIGIWILYIIVSPKAIQTSGNILFPSMSKIQFENLISDEISKIGNSHNPNDPHFNKLKDSLLTVYKVNNVQNLPFNYSGFVMKEGEKLSSKIYKENMNNLVDNYRKQNNFIKFISLINPYLAVKNISMSVTNSDFESYQDFQNQAEIFRYNMAQKMNDLQIKFISNQKPKPTDKPYKIDRKFWKEIHNFQYIQPSILCVIKNEWISIVSLLIWSIFPILIIFKAKNLKL